VLNLTKDWNQRGRIRERGGGDERTSNKKGGLLQNRRFEIKVRGKSHLQLMVGMRES